MDGIKNKTKLLKEATVNFFDAPESVLSQYKRLPKTLQEANELAKADKFIKKVLPLSIIKTYTDR